MRLDLKQSRTIEIMKRRGWIIYLLYVMRPKPRDLSTLTQ